jgi:hypothetical protein
VSALGERLPRGILTPPDANDPVACAEVIWRENASMRRALDIAMGRWAGPQWEWRNFWRDVQEHVARLALAEAEQTRWPVMALRETKPTSAEIEAARINIAGHHDAVEKLMEVA